MRILSDQNKSLRLNELEKGSLAVICEFEQNSVDFSRLRDMGLHIGTNFRVIKYAPGGGPIEIKARGYYMSIRKSVAQYILVKRK